MVLSNPAFWFIVITTWITGAVFVRTALKKRSELKAKKAPVPIRIRSRRRY